MSPKYQVYISASGYVDIETIQDLDGLTELDREDEIWEAFWRGRGQDQLDWVYDNYDKSAPEVPE